MHLWVSVLPPTATVISYYFSIRPQVLRTIYWALQALWQYGYIIITLLYICIPTLPSPAIPELGQEQIWALPRELHCDQQKGATSGLVVCRGHVYRRAQRCYHRIHFHFHQSGKHFVFSRAWLRSPLLDRKEFLILFLSNQNHEMATFHPICSTSCESVCKCKQNIKNIVKISKGKMGIAWQDGGWQLMFIRTGWSSKLTKPATSKRPKPNMSRGWESKLGRGGGDRAGNPSPQLLRQLLLWDIANLSTQCTRASLLKTSQLAEHTSTYEVHRNSEEFPKKLTTGLVLQTYCQ